MRGIPFISGWIRLRCVSADIGSLYSRLEKEQIGIYDVRALGELTTEFSIHQKDHHRITELTENRGDQLIVINRGGLYWMLRSLMFRFFLIGGISVLIALALWMPGRILFVHVEGNTLVPSRQILEAAESAELKFGTPRRSIRSEQIKNQILDLIPELKWAGVNTYGSRAVITVRERDDTEEQEGLHGVSHIVACRDGIVSSVTVTDGCGICQVGQAVKEGDILISGFTDCGITIRAEAAKGWVFAQTNRNLTVVSPAKWAQRAKTGQYRVRYSLILGKKRINFYNGSGISGGSCVKMSTEYVLTLPGSFELPITLVKELLLNCELTVSEVRDPELLLTDFASDYLKNQMVSGIVTGTNEKFSGTSDLWVLEGQYDCIEDIGIERDEQIGELHGKTNGTDRERRSGG